MSFRVDNVRVTLDLYRDFEGHWAVTFDYKPTGPDDPFLLAVLQKNEERIDALAAKLASGPPVFPSLKG